MSESTEMYLLRVVQLRENAQTPVSLSRLAEAMAISPVSVNEMCHKLMDKGLVTYIPYKGVLLTASGEAQISSLLRRRRLWVVFLEEKLGLDEVQAEAVACQLEHVTPCEVADRLDAYLGYPRTTAQGRPIPPQHVQ